MAEWLRRDEPCQAPSKCGRTFTPVLYIYGLVLQEKNRLVTILLRGVRRGRSAERSRLYTTVRFDIAF